VLPICTTRFRFPWFWNERLTLGFDHRRNAAFCPLVIVRQVL
jgi:hypothetical protein